MLLVRLLGALFLLLLFSCRQAATTGIKLIETPGNNIVSKVSITRYDAGVKSICLDSSGFYYLCCDTDKVHDVHYKPTRINLSKFTNELKLFQSFNALYFSKLDKSIGVSCGVSKEPFTVSLIENGQEYSFHPGICGSYNSTSSFYKLQQVKDFFLQLKSEYKTEF